MATISTIDDVSNIRSISSAVTANPGAIAIQNINGALKQVDDQGVVTSLGGGAGAIADREIALSRAQLLLGSSMTKPLVIDFTNTQQYDTADITGPGTLTFLTTVAGGVARLSTTGVAAHGTALGSKGATFAIPDVRNGKWYMRWRGRVPTVGDAQAVQGIALLPQSSLIGAPVVSWGQSARQSGDFTNWSWYSLNIGASKIASASSAVAIDANWHTHEMYGDGSTSIHFLLDGVEILSSPLTNLDNSAAMQPALQVYNGTTAAIRQLDTSTLICVLPGP